MEEGEEIAVNGTFSIDAAAQLAGKPSMMLPEGGATMTGHSHGGGSAGKTDTKSEKQESSGLKGIPKTNREYQKYEVNSEFREELKAIFEDYILLKDQLIKSDVTTSAKAASALLDRLQQIDMSQVSGDAHLEWMKDLTVLKETSQAIAIEGSLENQRKLFSPLSDQLYHTLSKFQVDIKAFRQFCPMAMDNEGAFWLSTSEKIRNPYFGDQMLTCGSVKAEL